MYINRFYSFAIVAILLTFNSCQSNSEEGPCEYNEEKFNMTILDILPDPENENHMIVLVDFDGTISYANKVQNLEDIRDVKTSKNWVEKNYITIGNTYDGIIHKKIEGSGDCEEEIIDWNQSFRK
mgnify:CR=1 FL=1